MNFSKQDFEDLKRLCTGLLLFFGAVYMVCLFIANAIGVSIESARHLIAAVLTIALLIYVLREILSPYRHIIICLSAAIFLIGAHGVSSELYVKNFTLLGMGDLPDFYNWFYCSVVAFLLGVVAFFVKRDFFYSPRIENTNPRFIVAAPSRIGKGDSRWSTDAIQANYTAIIQFKRERQIEPNENEN